MGVRAAGLAPAPFHPLLIVVRPALRHHAWWLVWLLSLPAKLLAAQHMPFDVDYVPVLSRGYEWLQGGAFPAVGTLSSVAAYNMPMLPWLHLPALALTQHAYSAFLLTMLAFNLVSTGAIFRLGCGMFNWRVGMIAATVFTFSETGVSSAYTAWAQQLLPGFYALVALCLWEWYAQRRGVFLALSGVIATAAVMTHFSAVVVLPAMLVFAMLSRARWQMRWLLIGIAGSVLLLVPYWRVQVERDFADVRAFLSQTPLVTPDILAQYEYLKPGGGPLLTPATASVDAVAPPSEPETTGETPAAVPQHPTPPSRLPRALAFALSVPDQVWRSLNLAFSGSYHGLGALHPGLARVGSAWLGVWQIVFWATTLGTIWGWVRRRVSQPEEPAMSAVRAFWLLSMILTVVGMLIVTRNSDQPTYFGGLVAWQGLLIAHGLDAARAWVPPRWHKGAIIALVVGFAALSSAERIARVALYDATQHSIANVSHYRFIEAATDHIAADWAGDETLTVSYDILPESRNLWWVVPWHTVDESYRMGMAYDFLLALHHGLHNTNADPIGTVDEADYIVVYEPALARYDTAQFSRARFGTIYVLEPLPP